jgi:tetratricopeptide (TPR) repeat protein
MKTILTITLLFFKLNSFGQHVPDEEAIHNILSKNIYFDTKAMNSAKTGFHSFLLQYKTSNYRSYATYMLAEIENKFNQIDSAEVLYKQVFTMTAPDRFNPNVKHDAAKRLAEIYISKTDYNTALEYLDEARTKFLGRYQCGTGYADDYLDIKCLYATCYSGQNNYTKAIDSLAPLMFANLMTRNSKLVKLLYETYLKIHTKREIREQFINAAKTLVIKKEKKFSFTYLKPVIQVFDKEIEIYTLDIYNLGESQQMQKCIEKLINSEIYKLAVTDENLPLSSGLLQGWQDIGAMGVLSLSSSSGLDQHRRTFVH